MTFGATRSRARARPANRRTAKCIRLTKVGPPSARGSCEDRDLGERPETLLTPKVRPDWFDRPHRIQRLRRRGPPVMRRPSFPPGRQSRADTRRRSCPTTAPGSTPSRRTRGPRSRLDAPRAARRSCLDRQSCRFGGCFELPFGGTPLREDPIGGPWLHGRYPRANDGPHFHCSCHDRSSGHDLGRLRPGCCRSVPVTATPRCVVSGVETIAPPIGDNETTRFLLCRRPSV